jgi:glyoxylase-like metal-dependent hydrolase (beta-lactamase superfamily II)
MSVALPPQLHVFVRDWLSGNNILLRGDEGNVLIDTGYGKHVPLTLALVASRTGLDGGLLSLIVNTHCHADHMGGNAALQRAYGCPIAVPEHEATLVDAWDTYALLIDDAGQRAERFTVDRRLQAGTTARWGGLDWQLLAAPGHAMGALVFYEPRHRVLVSGDALWHDGFGFVMPREMDPGALPATRATLDMIAALDVAIVVPGHGEPFTYCAGALQRAYARLAALEADSQRGARHAAKVLLTFNLLDREAFALAGLPAYLARTAFFRDLNDRYFHRTPPELATWLCDELCRAGVAVVENGMLVSRPRMRA